MAGKRIQGTTDCQADFSARKGQGTAHPQCHHTAGAGQPEIRAQPGWMHARQVLLDQPDLSP